MDVAILSKLNPLLEMLVGDSFPLEMTGDYCGLKSSFLILRNDVANFLADDVQLSC